MEEGPELKRKRKAGAGVTVVLGGQWGDEGKGKLVDILAQDADVVCRCQVGIQQLGAAWRLMFFSVGGE